MDSRAQQQNQRESKNLFHFLEFELFNNDSKSHRNIGIVDVIPGFLEWADRNLEETVIDSLAMTR